MIFQLRDFFSVGRNKFYVSCVTFVLGFIALMYGWYGPDVLPGFLLHIADTTDDDLGDDSAS